MKRTPDIFLSPRQLIERAQDARRKAEGFEGEFKLRLLTEARQDETMARMKRLVGDAENEVPAQ